ncbi:TNF-alpha receptor-like protein [Vaccinia virus]|nr:TNF-alpha receptor-like protein [Vaccinia virus]AXN56279.1 TNF-alpha receptor-like protein [Vaccinia virus]AXN56292.1 TNF-alpha receptor-like protein [Vaccinia virus]AXN56520.1 TNF-alpha receptor-like protein [Vaccinia virus]AXN56533.1 TNF-alpha receptor-like protein [Vaccinia virus]
MSIIYNLQSGYWNMERVSRSIINTAIQKSSYRRENKTRIVDLLLSYHPTLETMIDAFNRDIRYLYPEPLFACIRYALILDDDFPSKVSMISPVAIEQTLIE